MECLLKRTLSPNSQKTYMQAWAVMRKFLQTYNYDPPVTTSTLALFIAHLDMVGYAARTIVTYTSAISFACKLSGQKDPSEAFLIKKLLDAVGKRPSTTLQKLPITLPLLSLILEEVNHHYREDSYMRTLIRAVFSLAFHSCARIGELSVSHGTYDNVLLVDQVKLISNLGKVSQVALNFSHFKHKQLNHSSAHTVSAQVIIHVQYNSCLHIWNIVAGNMAPFSSIRIESHYKHVKSQISSKESYPILVWTKAGTAHTASA